MNKVQLQKYKWYTSDGISAYGYAYYKGKCLKESGLTSLFRDAKDLDKLVKDLNGSYSIVIEEEERCYAIVDKIRSYPLFICKAPDYYLITDDAFSFCQERPIEVNILGEYELLRAGYTFSTDTLIKDVMQIPAGSYGLVSTDCIIREYHNYISPKEERSPEAIKKLAYLKLEEAFSRMLGTIRDDQQIVIPLSGGYDSRLIACLCKQRGLSNVVCYTYGRKDSYEVQISKQVAEQLGYQWYFIEYTDSYIASFVHDKSFQSFVDTAGNCCSLPHYQDYFAIAYLNHNNLLEKDAVIVPGYVGDLYGGSKYPSTKMEAMREFSHRTLYNLIKDEFFEWNRDLDIDKTNIIVLSNSLGHMKVSNPEEFLNAFEPYWFMKSRASNFVLNSVRTYELFGYEWRVPLMDDEYISFWYTVPWKDKENSKIYNEFMFEYYFEKYSVDYYKQNTSFKKLTTAGSYFKSIIPEQLRNWLRNMYFKLHPGIYNCNSQDSIIKLFTRLNPSHSKIDLNKESSFVMMEANSVVTRVTINRLYERL